MYVYDQNLDDLYIFIKFHFRIMLNLFQNNMMINDSTGFNLIYGTNLWILRLV